MVSEAGTGIVRIIADTSKLSAQVAAGTEKATSAVGTRVSSLSTKITSLLTNPWTLAGVAAAGFAASAIKSAQEHEDALTRLSIAIHGATDGFEDQATALQGLTGYQDESILLADASLARFKLTRSEIHTTIPLILDYATALGIDAAEAAASFGRALLGNARGMKSLGIVFKATGDREKDLATLTKLLRDRVEGTSEALGKTFAGRLRILGARFDDIKEAIGNRLIPVLTDFVEVIDALLDHRLPSLDSTLALLARTADLLPPPLREIITAYQEVRDLFGNTTEIEASNKAINDWAHGIAQGKFSAAELEKQLLATGASTETVGAVMDRVKAKVAGLTEAQIAAADAAKKQSDAEKELAGGAVGLIGALDQLRSAQRDLNAARNDSKTTAAELRDAELAVLQAQLGMDGSLKDLIERQRAAGSSSGEVVDKFVALADKAGLTKTEIAGLTEFIQRYIDKLADIPDSVVTRVSVQGGEGFPGSHQQLAGGFHGVVRRPTLFMAGEAGPERLDVSPIGSARGGGAPGASGPLAVVGTLRIDYRTGLAELQGELDWSDRV